MSLLPSPFYQVITLKSKVKSSHSLVTTLNENPTCLPKWRINTFVRDFRLLPPDPKPSFQLLSSCILHYLRVIPQTQASHHSLKSMCSIPPHLYLSYSALCHLSSKFFYTFQRPTQPNFPSIVHQSSCPFWHLLTSYYWFNLIMSLIRILCINICSSLLCEFILNDMDHVLQFLVFHSSHYLVLITVGGR